MNKIERTLYEITGDIKDITTLLIPRAELAQASEPAPVRPVLSLTEVARLVKPMADAIAKNCNRPVQLVLPDLIVGVKEILDAQLS